MCLSSDKDYRLQGLLTKMQQQCFFTPLSDDQTDKMERLWRDVCAEEGQAEQARTLQLKVTIAPSQPCSFRVIFVMLDIFVMFPADKGWQ
jgi:predicted ATPase